MKMCMKRLALYTLALFGFLCVGWQAHALPPVYTLTAVFYEDDEQLARFMEEGLEYEYRYIPSRYFKGFDEKIPNPLKSYGMNTIHLGLSYRKESMITKLVPIDMRRLKDMPPQEYAQMQDLLGKCMAGVIIFDYANPKLQVFEEYGAGAHRDEKAYLEYDINFNYAFKLMKSVDWGQFVSVRIYNSSKLDPKHFERQEQGINDYMGDLERFYCRVDNRWDTRVQVETITSAFGNIGKSGIGKGWGCNPIDKEPLAKEYMGIDDNGEFVSPVVPPALGTIVQGEEIKTQKNLSPIVHSASLDAIIQDEETKTQEDPLPIVHSDSLDAIIQQGEEIKTQEDPLPIVHSDSLDAIIQDEEIKTQEDPSQGMCSAQLLMDEIRSWQSRIEQNEAEIARLEETTGYHAEPKLRDKSIKIDSMSSEELYNCMNELKEKYQNQDRTIQMLRNIPRAHLPLMQGKKDVKRQIEKTGPALLYSGLSDQTVQGEQCKTQGDPLHIVNPNEALAASAYPTENKKKQSRQLSGSQSPPLSLSQSQPISKWGKFKNCMASGCGKFKNWLVGLVCSSEDTK